MAEESLIPINIDLASMTSGVSTGTQLIAASIILIGIIVFVMWWLMHKHTFVGKQLTGGKIVVTIHRAREYTDKKTGALWWSLYNRKLKFPRPPDTVTTPIGKNKLYVEGYITENRDVIFAQDPEITTEDVVKLKPFSANQRVIMVEQFERADKKRKNNFFDKYGSLVIMSITLMVVFGLGLAFWDDFSKPMLEAKSLNNQWAGTLLNITQTINEITQTQKEITFKQQMIQGTTP